MGEMKRAESREEQQRREDRFTSTLAVGACVIAAVRLAREPDISNSPRVVAAVSDSIRLARMILDRVVR